MTICMGVLDDAGCILVADGLGVSACVEHHEIEKIDTLLGVSFALSGSLSGKRIMREALELTQNAAGVISLAGLSSALRQILIARDWNPEPGRNGQPPYWDLAFLLTDGYSLVLVTTDMEAAFTIESMETVGTGNEMAEGAYHHAIHIGVDVRKAAWDAVSIAARHSHGCGGKIRESFTACNETILVP